MHTHGNRINKRGRHRTLTFFKYTASPKWHNLYAANLHYMTMGIWTKETPLSPGSVEAMIDNMESVGKLAVKLQEVWCTGYLLIDYTHKTFWGDDIHPLVEQGLRSIGFTRKTD